MANNLDNIVDLIDEALTDFRASVPKSQRELLRHLTDRLTDLKTKGGKIAPAVENLRLIAQIRAEVASVIVNTSYQKAVERFITVFDKINEVQTAHFKTIESDFKPSKFADEMRKQMIKQTVDQLTESGIGVSVSDEITEILRQNVTSGSSYSSLADQLTENLLDTDTDGSITRYAKQITTDAVNQYSAQNLQLIASDLKYEWYRYAGHDIDTTRPFCDAMTDLEYFHVSEIPDLLTAEYLYYTKDGGKKKVPIYPRTGLPHGMIEGTDAANFFVRRGGYNCGHQIFPVIERIVPKKSRDRVAALPSYQAWIRTHKKPAA